MGCEVQREVRTSRLQALASGRGLGKGCSHVVGEWTGCIELAVRLRAALTVNGRLRQKMHV